MLATEPNVFFLNATIDRCLTNHIWPLWFIRITLPNAFISSSIDIVEEPYSLTSSSTFSIEFPTYAEVF